MEELSRAADFEEFEAVCDRFVESAVSAGRAGQPQQQRPAGDQRNQQQDRPNQQRDRPNQQRDQRDRPNQQRERPNQQRGQPRHRPGLGPEFDVQEASRLQKLYRTSKKRAMRTVLDGSDTKYTGSEETLMEYFTEVFSPREVDKEIIGVDSSLLFPNSAQARESGSDLLRPVSQREVSMRLSRMSNSAPGKDRLEYRHIRQADGAFRVTVAIFNRCLRDGRVPASWKTATTVLIYKKGDSADPANFRPIALQSCLYKLLMAVLSDRVTKWALDNDLISSSQKSARPGEGCYEHTFLLSTVVKDARRNQKNLHLAWLDLQNAFGSIPHDAIFTVLASIGAPEGLIALLRDVYTGASTDFFTPNGRSDPVPIRSGVKQGCPISPILFNLTLELVIRSVAIAASASQHQPKVSGHPISILAYADDLVILSKSSVGLQQLLTTASIMATKLQLKFKPAKCASLALECRRGTTVRAVDFSVQGNIIPALTEEQHYRYLGVPIGLYRTDNSLETLVTKMTEDIHRIESSLLAPWQKLDAYRTFIQPCAAYTLRAGDCLKKHLKSLRGELVKTARKVCNLPTRATTNYIFADRRAGGLGFIDPNIDADIQTVTQAVRMLSSPDDTTRSIAIAQLSSVVHRTIHRPPTEEEADQFMSGSMEGDLANSGNSGQISTLWSRARAAARRLKISFIGSLSGSVTTKTSTGREIAAKAITTALRAASREVYTAKLLSLPDQGKVAKSLHQDSYMNGSSWMNTGSFIRFCDWRFIHRARLNTLPTNATAKRWKPDTNPACRRCNHPEETLPHVLNHCKPNMVPIRRRHNLVQGRIKSAIRHGRVFVDQHVPEDPHPRERPDITVIEGNKVTIIDVCCPFDNGRDALKTAVAAKETKYADLKQALAATGKDVEVFGFAVGSLGSWYPGNEKALRRLGISKRFRTLMRKLMCIDTIKGSRDVYIEHMSGHRQYQEE